MAVSYTEHNVHYDSNGPKKIYYNTTGPPDGPLLIFIHGWPGIAATWKPQASAFAALGFRVAAPDMPGYGNSTVTKEAADYSHAVLIPGLLALLADLGREQAVWIGHDWGAGVVSSLAATQPQACRAVCLLCVPYRTAEMGKDELIKYSNRDIYPADKFPFAQWSYMEFYERDFEKATAFFEADSAGVVKVLGHKASTAGYRQPAVTATVTQDGGWFGGLAKPPPEFHNARVEDSVYAASGFPEIQDELIQAMEKTGWWAADAYYLNDQRNRAFNLEKSVNGGVLEFPFLFIEAMWDFICDTKNSRLSEPMRKHCKNLTEVSIDSGHWVTLEKSTETNAAIARWLVEEVPDYWPGYWKYGFVKSPRT